MAIFRPQAASSGGFLGYQNAGIASFDSKVDQFDWADVYLVVNLKLENSQYEQPMNIAGSFDREPDNTIKDCTLLRRLYYLFDAIGFDGGVTKEGNFEDAAGNEIEDIVSYLEENYAPSFPAEPSIKYCVYLYKEWNEKERKAYTRVVPKLVRNTESEKKDFQGYINFCKGKGVIKEYDDSNSLKDSASSNSGNNTSSQTQF
tara:strand:- start:492 stop:1097 length:606 start_codon:yes stop_codon:yes gene_type:complete